jgi:hypothetical protein
MRRLSQMNRARPGTAFVAAQEYQHVRQAARGERGSAANISLMG